ncbi:MAG TPA: site-specific DNA-methyltransferase [Solirubrobacterales bacterium]|nr:site-specific DNA-methyltransferase [Solirubrobacterales bacterium]
MALTEAEVRKILDRLAANPDLARDVAGWIAASDATGGEPIVAYRSSPASEGSEGLEGPALVRSVGGGENRLYHADNLVVLESLLQRGEKFRCVYIDPPFGTRQQFTRKATDDAAYCDAAHGGEYLGALRRRLVLLRELLDDEGSLFLHLDSSMVAEGKILLDELFGRSNFRSWITRRKCSSKNFTRKSFGDVTDFILFYSKGKSYVWNRPLEARTEEQEKIDFPKVDAETGERFALVPLHAPGRRNGATGGAWKGRLPPEGKHWQWTPEKLDAFEAAGDIYWTRNGTPRRKIWAADSPGTRMTNLLPDFRDPFNQNFSTTGYPTEKNKDLVKCLVGAATNPGDAILDCYCGSGTALHAAGELGRSWVGIDRGPLAVALSQRRLIEQALNAEDGSDPHAFAFQFWAAPDEGGPVDAVEDFDDVEFALWERRSSGGAFEVTELLPGGARLRDHLIAAPPRRGPSRRLVVFDHGGRRVELPDYEPSQASETRPA